MKSFIAVLLCLLVPSIAFASSNGYKVAYDGGSLQDLKAGAKAQLLIEQTQVRLVQGNETLVTIPAASITESPMVRMFTVESAQRSAWR
jgi:hypothetical protein